jgi:hypothetical protein
MINPFVITLKQVKSLLQLNDNIYDSAIETFIPVVSDFLVGKNGYLNNDYLVELTCDTNTSQLLTNVDTDDLEFGAVIECLGFDTGTVAPVIVNYDDDSIVLDKTSTSSLINTDLNIRVFPYGFKSTVAKMVWYLVGKNTISKVAKGQVKSEKIEDYSVTFADSFTVLGAGGYPKAFLDELQELRTPKFI